MRATPLHSRNGRDNSVPGGNSRLSWYCCCGEQVGTPFAIDRGAVAMTIRGGTGSARAALYSQQQRPNRAAMASRSTGVALPASGELELEAAAAAAGAASEEPAAVRTIGGLDDDAAALRTVGSLVESESLAPLLLSFSAVAAFGG